MSQLVYPQYPLDRRLGGPQIWSGCCGLEKNLLLLLRIKLRLSRPSLYRLSYPCSPPTKSVATIFKLPKWNNLYSADSDRRKTAMLVSNAVSLTECSMNSGSVACNDSSDNINDIYWLHFLLSNILYSKDLKISQWIELMRIFLGDHVHQF
jgi:hypothetical protein